MTELRIVRSRRKTLALQVLPTGEIVARAPLRLPERDIHAFAEQHAAWLEAAVARARAGSRAAQQAGILSETELQRLRTAAQADLTERVTRLAARMGVDFAGITIRAQRTRWAVSYTHLRAHETVLDREPELQLPSDAGPAGGTRVCRRA